MFSCGSVRIKPEKEKMDFVCEDEDEGVSLEVPRIYYEGVRDVDEEDSCFSWTTDSVAVVRGNHILKYTESTTYEVHMKGDRGESVWLNGAVAAIQGIDVDGRDDIRVSKEYWVEEYDLEKSEKRKYSVSLASISAMDKCDFYNIKSFLNDEAANYQ